MDKSKNGKVYNRNIGIERLESLVERLRDPISGCPWDIEQDNKSIAHYCIEEAHELQHAISLNKKDAIKSELGDLLFQIAFHCHIAEKDYGFTFDDVVQDICDKMIFRHPHVFNKEKRDGSSISTKEVKELWYACETDKKIDIEEEFGDVLFSIVNLGRKLDVDPEKSLGVSIKKFKKRIRESIKLIKAEKVSDKHLTDKKLHEIWEHAKHLLKKNDI